MTEEQEALLLAIGEATLALTIAAKYADRKGHNPEWAYHEAKLRSGIRELDHAIRSRPGMA